MLIRTGSLLVATSSILAEEKGTRSCDVEPEDCLIIIIFHAKSKSEKECSLRFQLFEQTPAKSHKIVGKKLSGSKRWVSVPRLLAFLDLPL